MTKPTIICFAPDNEGDAPKIFMRTLLYSTSEKGQYIQNLFVHLFCKDDGEPIIFNDWHYSTERNKTQKGGGLFLDQSGIEAYHHFLLSKSWPAFVFYPAEYRVEVFSEGVDEPPAKIFECKLNVKEDAWEGDRPLYFDWESHKQGYYSYPEFPG